MTNQISEQDLRVLAKQLAPKFTLDKYKSLLIVNNIVKSHIFDEPFGRFSKILIKEEYIRETLLFLDHEKLYELIDLLEEEGKLPKAFKRFSSSAKLEDKVDNPEQISLLKEEKEHTITQSVKDQAQTPGDIFISYSRKDEDYALELAQMLQNAGFDIWFDMEMVTGEEWVQLITKKIDECKVFIVIMTPNSASSKWVNREVLYAMQKNKAIFPLLLQGELWMLMQDKNYLSVIGGVLPDEKFFRGLEKFTPRKKTNTRSSSTNNADEDRRLHLKIIQDEIARTNGKSHNLKVWIVLIIVASLAVFEFTKDSVFLILALFPIILVWGLDTYYLQLERKLRGVYSDVAGISRNPRIIQAFAIPVHLYNEEKYSFWNVFSSVTLFSFYPVLVFAFLALYFFL